ncbi:MAG TPA: cystathionine beta-synthase [Candidatus Thermoplasmatota archaeon]|nr:cystathionine beta-synthase [Candidatus Thermoplasmatota archaeon]
MQYYNNILETIGNTPLVKLNKITAGLKPLVLAKCEFFNPGGSVKDRIGPAMVAAAEKEGKLKPGGTIVEGTSGNTGVGLALCAAVKGYKTVFTMSDKQSREKQLLLKSFGAKVYVCPTAVPPEHPDSYYSVAKRVHETTPNSIYPNQYYNENNPWAHYHSTGPELWRQTEGKITHYIATVGTGGTISGTGKYLKEKNPNIKVIGVDPEGSILKEYKETGEYHPEHAHSYKVEGFGEDIIPSTVWFDVIDEFVKVNDKESFLMGRRLAREEGIFAGGSSGSAVAAALKYLKRENLGPDAVVVILLPDSGSRYITKFFSDEWMAENGYLEQTDDVGSMLAAKDAPPGQLFTVAPTDPARAALDLMDKHGVSQVPVVDAAGMSVGSLTEADLLARAVADPSVLGRAVQTLMGAPLPMVEASEPTRRAIDLLKDHPAVLVKHKAGIEGILTRHDVVRWLAKR